MIRLIVDGESHEGWISAEIERSLDEFAHRFSLRYIDRWAVDGLAWPIRKGTPVTLKYNEETLITGHVNRSMMKATGNTWELSCEGRSTSGDLVDASAVHQTGHWKNCNAVKIVGDLLAPYGLFVDSNADDDQVFKRFALIEGESVHAAIDRLCKVRALLPVTQPDGGIRLLSVTDGPSIELEVRSAISRSLEEDDSGQFSDYLLRAVGIGTPEEAFSKAEVVDLNMRRYRPLVVIGDSPANTTQAKVRAQWEANVRAGRSERLVYVMPGALSVNGETYKPGDRFRVSDDLLGVDENMIVSRAVLRSSAQEFVTEIHMVRPETYAPLPYPNKKLTNRTKRGKKITKKTARADR